MAENQQERSQEDLTEEASPYRVEEFRRKGMVAQSRDVSSLAALIAAAVTCYVMAPSMANQMGEFMKEVFRTDLSARLDLGSLDPARLTLIKAMKLMITVASPVVVAGFLLGAFGSFSQIGSVFSWEPIQPDFSKIDPIAGFRRMFSAKHAIDGLKTAFKVTIVLLVAYYSVKTHVLSVGALLDKEAGGVLEAFAKESRAVFLPIVGVLTLFAAIDFGFQRWEFGKSLRMTKQEAKQEHREREGDPMIKARIRQVQREMARRRMMQAVKKADVIVTNPTHIAVALTYAKNSMDAPKVVAKGADLLAQRIKKVAAEAGIPMVENVPLARTLFKSVKIGQTIPRALYQAVAEVLAYVYRLKNRGI